MHSFVHMAHVFVYWIWTNTSHITCFNFESTNKTSKLGGELTICPMTIGQGLGV